MLDQNTDRMWYVIGAIIIGGLILTSSIMLFTDVAFAEVQSSFNNQKVNARVATDRLSLGDEGDGVNLLDSSEINMGFPYGTKVVDDGVFIGTYSREHNAMRLERVHYFGEPGDYTYSIKARFNGSVDYISWMGFDGGRVLGLHRYGGTPMIGDLEYIWAEGRQSTIQDVSNEWSVYSVSFRVSEPGNVRIRGYQPWSELGDTVEIKDEKLEKGTKSTME